MQLLPRLWVTKPERLVDLTVLLACLVALGHGWHATHDLDWPPDFDLYRDASIAQTILDGYGLSDPAYTGERLWYNPLVPAVVAALSRLFRSPAVTTYARAGAYLNLLAPICFYAMVVRLFKDRIVAAASTLAFLFVTCQYPPSRACATYSPWLFTANVMQAGFYVTLILYDRALEKNRRCNFMWVGLMLGLTFLGQPAPALILGGIIALQTAAEVRNEIDRPFSSPRLHEAILRLGIVVVIAAAVSFPYSRLIVGHYRLQILNPAPHNWIFSTLRVENFPSFIRTNLTVPNLIALFGLLVLWAPPRDRTSRLLTSWLWLCLGFMGLSYISQLASRLDLPAFHIVPPFHFLFYLKALTSVLFGYGLLASARFVTAFLQHVLPRLRDRLPDHRRTLIQRWALAIGALIAVVAGYGRFVDQPALNETRERAQTVIPIGWRAAYAWIRRHTEPQDVFLASPYFGLHVVTPAGRKVVALKPVFSNPFVAADLRVEHSEKMYEYLRQSDGERFAILSSAYSVDYIAATPGTLDGVSPPAYAKSVFTAEDVTIYALSLPPDTHVVNLGNKVEFLGSVLSPGEAGSPQMELYMRCIGRMEEDYTLWFHADAEEQTNTFDHVLPTSEWKIGQIVSDTIQLDLPPGRYDLSFGLWTWQSGQRLWRQDTGEAGIELGCLEIE